MGEWSGSLVFKNHVTIPFITHSDLSISVSACFLVLKTIVMWTHCCKFNIFEKIFRNHTLQYLQTKYCRKSNSDCVSLKMVLKIANIIGVDPDIKIKITPILSFTLYLNVDI